MFCILKDIIESPYTIAIFSVVLTASTTFLLEKYIQYRKNVENRKAYLRIVRDYFSIARSQLVEIKTMSLTQIHPYINASVVLSLLQGGYLSPKNDVKLIMALNKYVFDVEQINRVFSRVDFASGGFTAEQISNSNQTMQNLKDVVPEFLRSLDSCVREIDIIISE